METNRSLTKLIVRAIIRMREREEAHRFNFGGSYLTTEGVQVYVRGTVAGKKIHAVVTIMGEVEYSFVIDTDLDRLNNSQTGI